MSAYVTHHSAAHFLGVTAMLSWHLYFCQEKRVIHTA